MQPPLDLATYIADNVAGLTLGTNVFHGIERAAMPPQIPTDAVFVSPGAGTSPTRVMSLRVETRQPMIHIRTRAKAAEQAETWARAIQDLLQMGLPTGYLDAEALQSEPTLVAESTSQLMHYTMTFRLTYERDALV
jgi:Bacteriophage minor capsid protein